MRILLVTEKFPDPIHTGAIVRTVVAAHCADDADRSMAEESLEKYLRREWGKFPTLASVSDECAARMRGLSRADTARRRTDHG